MGRSGYSQYYGKIRTKAPDIKVLYMPVSGVATPVLREVQEVCLLLSGFDEGD